jgi:gluconokinase
MVIIVMGVAGSGKSTIGLALAHALGWRYIDADDLHPAANIAKMSRGEALTDVDRQPWLDEVRGEIVRARSRGESLVIACSALKVRYRQHLAAGDRDVVFAYLAVSPDVLAERLAARQNHFAGPTLLDSQLEALEAPSPKDALVLDAHQPPTSLVSAIRRALQL